MLRASREKGDLIRMKLDEYYAACRNEIFYLVYQKKVIGFRVFVTNPSGGKFRFLYFDFDKKYVKSEDKRKFLRDYSDKHILELKQVDNKLVADDELYGQIYVTELKDTKLVDKYLGYAIEGIQRRIREPCWREFWISCIRYDLRVNEAGGAQLDYGCRCFILNAEGRWVREKIDYVVRDFVYDPNLKISKLDSRTKRFVTNVREKWVF